MPEIDAIRHFLGICTLAHYAVLLVWFAVFSFAHDGLHRLHSRWFRLEPATFDALHYGGMAAYKIGVLLFFLIPWAVLRWA